MKVVLLGCTGFIGSSLYVSFQNLTEQMVIEGFNSSTLDLTQPSFVEKLGRILNEQTILVVVSRSRKKDQTGAFNEDIQIASHLARSIERQKIRKCVYLSSNSVVEIFGDGRERRDYLFIHDLSDIVLRFLSGEKTGIYNLGTGTRYSFQQILDFLKNISEAKFETVSLSRERIHVDCHFEITKLLQAFPDLKFTSLEEGLREAFLSFKEQILSELQNGRN